MHKYNFVFEQATNYYFRDSLNYIITINGQILFSAEDFSKVFYTDFYVDSDKDTLYKESTKMNNKDLAIQVPAGTFTTSTMQTTFLYSSKYLPPDIDNPRYLNFRYAKNVGLILETEEFFVHSSNVVERRLLRYYLN